MTVILALISGGDPAKRKAILGFQEMMASACSMLVPPSDLPHGVADVANRANEPSAIMFREVSAHVENMARKPTGAGTG